MASRAFFEENAREFAFSFILVIHVFELYVSIRQHARFSSTDVPAALAERISSEKFQRSQVRPFRVCCQSSSLLILTETCV